MNPPPPPPPFFLVWMHDPRWGIWSMGRSGVVSGLVETLEIGTVGNSTNKIYVSIHTRISGLGFLRAVTKSDWASRDKVGEAVLTVAQYTTRRCLVEGNQTTTVRGHDLSAVKHYHKMNQGWEVLTMHWMVGDVLRGVDRVHGGSSVPCMVV